MRTFYTAGTVGDSYVILCKLYPIAKKERILCRHYTPYVPAHSVVKEIFSLLSNIQVEMRMSKDPEMYVCGGFVYEGYKEEVKEYGLVPEYYPVFEPADASRFKLPAEYEVLQIEAGTDPIRRKSKLPGETINNITRNATLPIVIIGDKSFGMKKRDLMDLGGRTTIREAITVIRNSKHFYGRLGFLGFVAVSQKVPSSIEVPPPLRATAQITIYAAEEWKKFFVERL